MMFFVLCCAAMLANEASAARFGQQQPDGAHSDCLRSCHVLQGDFAIYVDNTHFILELRIRHGQVGWPGFDSSWPWLLKILQQCLSRVY